MSEVFEGYERQYCELSASLFKKCTSAGLLDGGNVTSARYLRWEADLARDFRRISCLFIRNPPFPVFVDVSRGIGAIIVAIGCAYLSAHPLAP